ncbi:MAG: flippase-like domain-containing protein [Deltaproteobacteria bacterium]|nr:flippase-like domain-containing protein [Deltaproteobacteria bacterium]
MGKYIKILGFPILGLILWRTDLGELGRILETCRPEYLAVSLGVTATAIIVKALRWNLMLRYQGFSYPWLNAIIVYFSGIFIGIATPGRLGELSRVLYVKRDIDITAGMCLSSVVFDRLLDLYLLMVVGFAACFRFDIAGRASPLFLAFLGILAIAPLLLLSPRISRFFVRRMLGRAARKKFVKVLSDGVEDFFSGVEKLLSWRLGLSVLLTLVAYAFFFYAGYLLVKSLGIPIGLTDTTLVLGLANLLSLVPITVAGVGTRDAVFIFAFSSLALAEAQALGFSALVLAVFYLGSGLLGLGCFVFYRS